MHSYPPATVARPASAGDVSEALVALSAAESALTEQVTEQVTEQASTEQASTEQASTEQVPTEQVPGQRSGPGTASRVRGRGGLGLAELLDARPAASERSTAEVVDHIDGWARVIAYAQARQAGEIAELFARREAEQKAACADPGRRAPAPDPVRVTTSEVALALRASPRSAELLLDDAITLTALPSTALALRRGQIDLATVRAIGAGLAVTCPEHRAMLEAAALASAIDGATAGQVRSFVRRTAMKLDTTAAATRAEAARADRGMSKTEVVDDMGELRVVMGAAELKAVWDQVTTAAHALPATDHAGHHVSLDDRRVTALVAMITHPDHADHPDTHHNPSRPRPGRGRWKADLVVAASTLAGHDDDPALLPGYGLVSADVARTIAADADWRTAHVDADDQVLTRSSVRHRPPTDPTPDPDTGPDRQDQRDDQDQRDTALARRVDDITADTTTKQASTEQASTTEQALTLEQALTAQHAQRSTHAYRPTVSLRDHVEALHRRCRFPGCRRPATECDLDHVTAHRIGGATAACNLIPLCRVHHVLKHTDGWSITLAPDRTVTWTTPSHRRYRDPPPTIWD